MEKAIIKRRITVAEFTLYENEGKSRHVAEILRQEFLSEFQNGISNFWLNLDHIENVNSSFVGIVSFMNSCLTNNGKVVIFGIKPRIREVLTLAGLTKIPTVEITEEKL